jgi:predicted anti-sigma-YlaC factor YlaD
MGAMLAMAIGAGCSVNQYVARAAGDALASGGTAYAADDDIELVGAATPFALKTVESLLETVPDHRPLLLAASRGFTQYAYAYVQLPAETLEQQAVDAAYLQRGRALRLYLRARDYGLRGLGVDTPAKRHALIADPQSVLARTTAADVPLLYWTGAAWAAAISLGKDDPAMVAGLPAIDAMIMRAAEQDPDWEAGTLRTFLVSYELARTNPAPDALDRARAHFARAVELCRGQQAAPYIALAESVAVAQRDRAQYVALLRQALAVDPNARAEWRLANLVMQRRAQWLLDNVDLVFMED